LNHDPLNIDTCKEYGIAFGEAVLKSSPPSRSQIRDAVTCHHLAEFGFGGWADEKIKTAREATPILSRKESHPQHLTISQEPVGPGYLAREKRWAAFVFMFPCCF
jgi:hypothetical protein